MGGYSVLAVVLVNLAFAEVIWIDHLNLMTVTGEEAPFYAIAAVMFTSAAFFLGVAAIHAGAAAVFQGGGGHVVRLQRFLVTTATAASMAAVVARWLALALARVNKTCSADARTDVV